MLRPVTRAQYGVLKRCAWRSHEIQQLSQLEARKIVGMILNGTPVTYVDYICRVKDELASGTSGADGTT